MLSFFLAIGLLLPLKVVLGANCVLVEEYATLAEFSSNNPCTQYNGKETECYAHKENVELIGINASGEEEAVSDSIGVCEYDPGQCYLNDAYDDDYSGGNPCSSFNGKPLQCANEKDSNSNHICVYDFDFGSFTFKDDDGNVQRIFSGIKFAYIISQENIITSKEQEVQLDTTTQDQYISTILKSPKIKKTGEYDPAYFKNDIHLDEENAPKTADYCNKKKSKAITMDKNGIAYWLYYNEDLCKSGKRRRLPWFYADGAGAPPGPKAPILLNAAPFQSSGFLHFSSAKVPLRRTREGQIGMATIIYSSDHNNKPETHLLTAGHNLYDHKAPQNLKWSINIRFHRALNDGNIGGIPGANGAMFKKNKLERRWCDLYKDNLDRGNDETKWNVDWGVITYRDARPRLFRNAYRMKIMYDDGVAAFNAVRVPLYHASWRMQYFDSNLVCFPTACAAAPPLPPNPSHQGRHGFSGSPAYFPTENAVIGVFVGITLVSIPGGQPNPLGVHLPNIPWTTWVDSFSRIDKSKYDTIRGLMHLGKDNGFAPAGSKSAHRSNARSNPRMDKQEESLNYLYPEQQMVYTPDYKFMDNILMMTAFSMIIIILSLIGLIGGCLCGSFFVFYYKKENKTLNNVYGI